jgi:hypothetical protein
MYLISGHTSFIQALMLVIMSVLSLVELEDQGQQQLDSI